MSLASFLVACDQDKWENGRPQIAREELKKEQIPQKPRGELFPLDVPLKSKLEMILANASLKLSESEIVHEEYSRFIFEELKKQGLLLGGYFDNGGRVGTFLYHFNEKLKVKDLSGLMHDYYTLEKTSISKQSQKDIDANNKFINDVGVYLRAKIREKVVSKEQFENLISDYISSNFAYIDKSRQAWICGRVIWTYEKEFENVRSDDVRVKRVLNDYTIEDIKKALESTELK